MTDNVTRIIIVEDEINIRKDLERQVKMYCPKSMILDSVGTVKDAMKSISELKPDLVLLDIRLTDGTGFDVLEKTIPFHHFKVIFTTAYSEYAIEAIKNEAVDYLLKPIIPSELIEAYEKAVSLIEKETKFSVSLEKQAPDPSFKRIVLSTKNDRYIVNLEDVLFCKSSGNYTYFVMTSGKEILISKTLKHFEDYLIGFNFIRVHQSYMVNGMHIKSLNSNDEIVLSTERRLKISRRKKRDVVNFLNAT